MTHCATHSFWNAYAALPKQTQKLADKAFQQLRDNPRHPSLRLKKVGELWSARVSIDCRALALEDGNGLVWIWIGVHAEYDRTLR